MKDTAGNLCCYCQGKLDNKAYNKNWRERLLCGEYKYFHDDCWDLLYYEYSNNYVNNHEENQQQ